MLVEEGNKDLFKIKTFYYILFTDKNCINKKDTFENVYQMNLVSDSQIVGCIGSVGEFKNNAELYPHKKPECA